MFYGKKYYQSIAEDIKIIHNINSSNVMEYPHFHDHYELHFTLSYNLKFIIDNIIFNVAKGSVFAISNFVPHMTVVPDGAWFERYTVHIKPETLMEINNFEGFDLMELFQYKEDFPAYHIKLSQEEVHVFEQILSRGIESMKSDSYGSAVYRKLIVAELLFFLLRVKHNNKQHRTEINDDENGIVAKKIMDFIIDNIDIDINLDLLEKEFFISKYSICRIFKEYCGVTINQYITARRIYLACDMLKSNPTVYKVCEMSGFSDYGHFIRTFKKHVGITPKQYSLQFETQGLLHSKDDKN